MDDSHLTAVKAFFDRYTQAFLVPDPPHHAYRLKIDHTRRVWENVIDLCKKVNVKTGVSLRAQAAALLHDLGRFPQYRDFQTFSDAVSVNHAALGCREIKAHGVLERFDPGDRNTVLLAVEYHNRYHIPCETDPDAHLVTRLLRDADKLDILKVMTEKYEADGENPSFITLNLSADDRVSDELLRQVKSKQLLDSRSVRCLNDLKLLQISWVFDINFAPALAMAHERRYFDTIFATLPQTDGVRHLSDFIEHYICETISQAVYAT